MTTTTENPRKLIQFSGWRSLPVILQSEIAECGLACLAMVAGYHGYKETLSGLRRSYAISQGGANLQQLIQIAERLKLNSRALRLEMEDLSKLKTPCILHWDLNHFVVLKKVRRNSAVIHNPAVGVRELSFKEISQHFTGVALELTPTQEFKATDKREKLKLSLFWSKITGLKASLGRVLLLSVVLQLLVLATPYYSQLVVDDVLLSFDDELLLVLAIGFGLVMLTQVITQVIRSWVVLHLGSMLNIQMAANLFRHLLHLPLDYFQKRHIGDVISRFSSLQQVKELLTTGVVEAVMDGLMALVTLAMLFIYSATLAWVVVASVTLYALVRLALYKPLRQKSEEAITAQAKESTNFIESVRAIQTIKLFGCESKRQALWQNRFADTLNADIRVGKLNIGFTSANQLLFGLENVIVIYLAATLVMAGEFSVGMLFAFISYKQQFSDRVANLIEKLIQFRMLGLHLDRLADIALTPAEPKDSVHLPTELSGGLELQDIAYHHSGSEQKLFENISLSIKAGESIALIGPSGCGKTTLVKIMLGLLKPTHGTIRVDEHKLEHVGLSHYREHVASVMQDDQLLSGSIAENISFFAAEQDMERVVECAQLAAIHQDIMAMPMNYNSLVGDMGSSLSGGQKQRILLARALYQQPKILFLDEATSHLDVGYEAMVNQSVSQLKLTRIIVAHRPETMLTAQRILQLNPNGVVDVTQDIRQQLGAVA